MKFPNLKLADCNQWNTKAIYENIRIAKEHTISMHILSADYCWYLSRDYFEMKIDDNHTVYELPITHTEHYHNYAYFNTNHNTIIKFTIPPEIIPLIQKANSLGFRFYYNKPNTQQESAVFEINRSVLNTWKIVVDRE